MTDIEKRLLTLELKQENFHDQSEHVKSLYISEQRNLGNHGRDIIRLEKMVDKHEETLYNNGKGHNLRIASLEQHRESNKVNLALWISLVSAGAAIISIVLK